MDDNERSAEAVATSRYGLCCRLQNPELAVVSRRLPIRALRQRHDRRVCKRRFVFMFLENGGDDARDIDVDCNRSGVRFALHPSVFEHDGRAPPDVRRLRRSTCCATTVDFVRRFRVLGLLSRPAMRQIEACHAPFNTAYNITHRNSSQNDAERLRRSHVEVILSKVKG
jgi:hypothetical protein